MILLAAFAGLILVLIFLAILHRYLHPKTRPDIVILDAERRRTLQRGIARLNQVRPESSLDGESSTKTNYYVSRQGISTEPFFDWAYHPSLIVDAVENGWPRFAFKTSMSSPSHHSGTFSVRDQGNKTKVEIGWEICDGSADYIQKIRLNPGLKKIITSLNWPLSVIRAALPLPGPQFGNSSFPQEAYFEIKIWPCNERDIHGNLVDKEAKKNKLESEKVKLIGKDFSPNNNSESSSHVTGRYSQGNRIGEVKPGGKQEGENERTILLSVGLTGGGHLPSKTPGSFPVSIGFNSCGSVCLNGTKLVSESEKNEWGRSAEDVIGCGYNPGQKKVFFTVNSRLVYVIHCKTEEFGHPLYPTIAANIDIVVLANFGQCPFKFEPGNLQRTPNPCFIRPQENSHGIGYEDSKELFSMGRIDAKWQQWSARRSNHSRVNSIKAMESDQESDGDLFEIHLR